MATKKKLISGASHGSFAVKNMARGVIVRKADGSFHASLKISDPAAKADLKALRAQLTSSPENAAAFLHSAGITTASGKLSKRFGG